MQSTRQRAGSYWLRTTERGTVSCTNSCTVSCTNSCTVSCTNSCTVSCTNSFTVLPYKNLFDILGTITGYSAHTNLIPEKIPSYSTRSTVRLFSCVQYQYVFSSIYFLLYSIQETQARPRVVQYQKFIQVFIQAFYFILYFIFSSIYTLFYRDLWDQAVPAAHNGLCAHILF